MKIRTNWRDGAAFDATGAGAGGGAGAGAGAGGAAGGAAGGGAPGGGTGGGTPWYQGKVDGELLGHMQTLGWHTKTAEDAAIEAAKAHREARSFIGLPESRLLKLPAEAKDEAGWKNVWTRLGVPADAKDYDFTSVKFADGTAIDPTFADAIRQAAFSHNIPKDAAAGFAQSVVKFHETADAAEAAELTAKIDGEKSALAKNWGQNVETNKFIARQAAIKLGFTPEIVDALEKVAGYKATMEGLLKAGEMMGEDKFVAGNNPAQSGRMTVEQAQARLAEAQNDTAWGKRLLDGDPATMREFQALTTMINNARMAA